MPPSGPFHAPRRQEDHDRRRWRHATNYNIKEKAGSSTADGVIDAADAQRRYPQGHGDPADNNSSCIVHTGGTAANLVFLWSRKGNTLYATASGTGFQPGAPEPAKTAVATKTDFAGRPPQTPPPPSPSP